MPRPIGRCAPPRCAPLPREVGGDDRPWKPTTGEHRPGRQRSSREPHRAGARTGASPEEAPGRGAGRPPRRADGLRRRHRRRRGPRRRDEGRHCGGLDAAGRAGRHRRRATGAAPCREGCGCAALHPFRRLVQLPRAARGPQRQLRLAPGAGARRAQGRDGAVPGGARDAGHLHRPVRARLPRHGRRPERGHPHGRRGKTQRASSPRRPSTRARCRPRSS